MAGERSLPGLGLEAFWNLGSNGFKTGLDSDIRILSALVQMTALSRVTALPGSPANGDIYIVPSGAAEHANEIAIRDNGEWIYLLPKKGFVATVADENVLVWYSGAAWSTLPTGAPTPYDVGGSYNGAPTDSLVLLRYPFNRAVSFPLNMANSHAVSGVAATASAVFSLRKNGVQFATMTFAAGTALATFAGAATSFAIGDVLTIMSPSPADSTLADIGFALAGTRL
ncbi:MAG: DUF2793 domain-containing protein [Alphaproteobacteria bacterium]|nr:DUF2793 domain-containing protein [Alphaproteobacteria bacterium]